MTIGIVANGAKSQTPEAVGQLRKEMQSRGLEVVIDRELQDVAGIEPGEFVDADEMAERAEAITVFGGDGTMLANGRRFAGTDIPLVGFNLGRLGFLAEFSVEEIPATIDALLGRDYRVVERTLLQADIEGDAEPLLGMNDLVITKPETRLLVDLDVHVNGDLLGTYTADGLIIATPTGSTAYALAVGGPVVAPDTSVLVVTPIAPHMLTARPIILSDDAEIRITPTAGDSRDKGIRVMADGQNARYLSPSQSCTIRRHEKTVSLMKSARRTYFDVLRAKLLWGRRPQLEE